jgi:3-phenylpropionate/cinnamic acid dioxygenase small subunit
MSNVQDIADIQQLVARFANSFDCKDWDALASCLSEQVFTDYSELRGSPPETMTREKFIELRKHALQNLRTHHLVGNFEIELRKDQGEAKVSMMIYRRNVESDIFNTHCFYRFGLERSANGWRINSIVQKVFWNEGQTIFTPEFRSGRA